MKALGPCDSQVFYRCSPYLFARYKHENRHPFARSVPASFHWCFFFRGVDFTFLEVFHVFCHKKKMFFFFWFGTILVRISMTHHHLYKQGLFGAIFLKLLQHTKLEHTREQGPLPTVFFGIPFIGGELGIVWGVRCCGKFDSFKLMVEVYCQPKNPMKWSMNWGMDQPEVRTNH